MMMISELLLSVIPLVLLIVVVRPNASFSDNVFRIPVIVEHFVAEFGICFSVNADAVVPAHVNHEGITVRFLRVIREFELVSSRISVQDPLVVQVKQKT
jgi:hypothetical protein